MRIQIRTCAELGVLIAATRYFLMATSMSEWSWMIEPAAKIVLGLRGSCVREFPRKSNALKFSPVRRYSSPSVVSRSLSFHGLLQC